MLEKISDKIFIRTSSKWSAYGLVTPETVNYGLVASETVNHKNKKNICSSFRSMEANIKYNVC